MGNRGVIVTSYGECVREKGAPVRPLTKEEYLEKRNDLKLAEKCEQIRNGREDLKPTLPYRTVHCLEFRNNHRSIADALRPVNRLMVDFDENKGESEAICARALELQEQGKWKIFLVEESVRKGTHVLIAIPQGMTAEEANEAFATDMGYVADKSVKDVARAIFMVPQSYVLYQSDDYFEPEEIDEWPTRKKGAYPVKVSTCAKVCLPSTPTASAFPDTYEGIPYAEIVEELTRQLGGEPAVGGRNNFVLQIANQLKYICDKNPSWIVSLLPTYGLDKAEVESAVRSACNYDLYPKMPVELAHTIAACQLRHTSLNGDWVMAATPPPMPTKLPPLIKLLTSKTPGIYKPTVAQAVFPALGTHLWKTYFLYIDKRPHEATLMCLLIAPTGAGKDCVNEPIDRIMADVYARDRVNLEKENDWKMENKRKGANKDKNPRPENLVIQVITTDITSAAFNLRMKEADGHFLYAKMNEVDMFDALRGNGKGGHQFQLMCLAFDYGNRYGQTRVGDQSVSENVCVRFNWNASTTPSKGRRYFQKVLTDGPISRLNICTIPEQEIDADIPVFGEYDADFDERLRPYIERLNEARGLVTCKQAEALAKSLDKGVKAFARLTENKVYANLSRRANVIAYLKAMVLYIAHGCRWDKTMADFVRWSLHYDLWCKMHFFGADIEAEEEKGMRPLRRGKTNGLVNLPEVFTLETVIRVRQSTGQSVEQIRHLVSVWKSRGFIETNDGGKTFRKTELYYQMYNQMRW